ncbi:MAG TPA: hypothetical protein EYH30_01150 [Anaerolineales bacterium]|nr:hypothetical protein [Anaerolineae bacterium]HIQ00732.1 hypothetical protein [Anaerolineales bacterium]
MPTDFLYPVKRASEAVWWAVVPASDRPTVALELALRRMEEVEYLLDKGEAVPEELWDDLTERLANVGSMADGQVPEHVRARLEHHLRVLEQQMARHPDNPGLRRAVEASRRALEVLCCPSEETHPPTATPSLTPPGQGGGQGPPSTPPGQGEGQGPSPTPPGRGKK